MELEELQAAILRNKQATGNLAGLDEEYSRAAALRDTEFTGPDKYGQVSPLLALGQSMKQARGQRGMAELAPQREAARTAIGEGEAAIEGNALRMALDKEKRDAGTYQSRVLTEAQNRDQARAKEAERLENEGDYSGDTLTFQSPDGKHKIAVTRDNAGRLIQEDGSPVPPGYIEVPTSSAFGVRGKAMTTEQRNNIGNRAQRVVEINRLTNEFRGNYAKVRDVPTQFANNFLMATSKADLMKYVDEETDAQAKANAQWWADFKFNMLERRHELFGATLTKNEQAAWDEALLISPGMDEAEIEKRLARLTASENERLVREGNMGMTDPLESNRNAYQVGMEGVLEWNPDTQRYSVPGIEEVAVDESQGEQEMVVTAEITPEEKVAYGPIVQGFTPDQMTKFNTLSDPQKMDFLHRWYVRSQNTMGQ